MSFNFKRGVSVERRSPGYGVKEEETRRKEIKSAVKKRPLPQEIRKRKKDAVTVGRTKQAFRLKTKEQPPTSASFPAETGVKEARR